ncbi:MAG: hypothetical protein LC725_04280, partial [Lentisphaerae bacterium]|nr:hypothetical protein [Lentisphaerota bacterium]
FDPQRRIWSEMGDPEALQTMDKVYFASARGCRKMPGGGYPYESFIQIPTLNPEAPLPLLPGGRQVVRIELAEKPEGRPATKSPALTLSIKTGIPEGPGLALVDMDTELNVVFNGHLPAASEHRENWRCYCLEPGWLRPGENTVEVIHPGQTPGLHLLDVMVTVNRSGQPLDTAYLDQTRKKM